MRWMASRLPLPFSRRMAVTASSAKCSLSPVRILLLSVVMAMLSRSWRNAAGRAAEGGGAAHRWLGSGGGLGAERAAVQGCVRGVGTHMVCCTHGLLHCAPESLTLLNAPVSSAVLATSHASL